MTHHSGLTNITLHIQYVEGVMRNNEVEAVLVLHQYGFGEAISHNVGQGKLLSSQPTHHIFTAAPEDKIK